MVFFYSIIINMNNKCNNTYGGYWIANGAYLCCDKGLKKYGMNDMTNMMNKYMLGEYGMNSRYATMNRNRNEYTTPPVDHNINTIESFSWTDNLRSDYTNWMDESKRKLLNMTQLFGDNDSIDRKRGGSAVWNKSSLNNRGICLDIVYLLDKKNNNIGVGIRMKIGNDKANEIRNMNKKITYNGDEIMVQGDELIECITILTYTIMYVENNITKDEMNKLISQTIKSANDNTIIRLLNNICYLRK